MLVPALADKVAEIAISIAVYGSLGMAALLLFLVMRRDRKERHAVAAQANARALTREIMGALSGGQAGNAYALASPNDRIAAVSHLGRLVRGEDRGRLIAFVEDNRMLDGVVARLRRRRVARRVEAVRTLGGVGGAQAIAALTGTLKEDADGTVRLEAAAQLAQLGALPAVGILLDSLDLERATVTPLHHALFRALAPHRGAELIAMMAQPITAGTRALVIDALGWTEDYSALPTLSAAATDSDPEVRLNVVRSSARLNHPAAARWILPMLDDADDRVRSEAARACATMGLRAARQSIEAMLHDRSAWARLRAKAALAVLGPAV
jgi:HEAT repeat protein